MEIPASSLWATISPQQQHWCKSLSTPMKGMALLKFYTGTIFLNIFFCRWCFVFMKHRIKCINTKFNEFCILKCCKWERNTMPQMFLLCLSPKGPSVKACRSVMLSMHSSHIGGDRLHWIPLKESCEGNNGPALESRVILMKTTQNLQNDGSSEAAFPQTPLSTMCTSTTPRGSL